MVSARKTTRLWEATQNSKKSFKKGRAIDSALRVSCIAANQLHTLNTFCIISTCGLCQEKLFFEVIFFGMDPTTSGASGRDYVDGMLCPLSSSFCRCFDLSGRELCRELLFLSICWSFVQFRAFPRAFPRGLPVGFSGGTWSKSSAQCARSARIPPNPSVGAGS